MTTIMNSAEEVVAGSKPGSEPTELSKEIRSEMVSTLLEVMDRKSLEIVTEHVVRLKSLEKKIKAYWRPLKDRAYATHKAICGNESDMLTPLRARIKLASGKVNAYLAEQARIEKMKQAEAERKRLEAEREQQRLLEEAIAAEEAGKEPEEVEEKLDEAAHVVPPPPPVAAPKTPVRTASGSVSSRKELVADVSDMRVLCAEIGAGRAPVDLVEIRRAALKRFAKTLPKKEFPGLSIREDTSGVFRGR